ncbi:MAG TPA: DUF5671 domain-containing protein [Nocardioidaceae bacterium]|nr:DUF5671 domain-containing protein [Nocardioidaceae bacterium]
MAVGLLFLILVAVLVVLAVRKVGAREGGGAPDGHGVRRFFQYLLLYGLLVVVGVGISGLLGRLLERDVLAAGDETELARNLAFTVVGVPLYTGVALWSRRRFAADTEEPRSLGWGFYITAASLTSLVLGMTGLGQVLEWATGLNDYSGRGLATFLVWGALWVAHWRLDARVTPHEHSRVHHLAGSLIGLATAATGLAGVLAGALRSLLGLEGDAVLAGAGSPILQGGVTLAVGAPVWFVYWVRTAAKSQRDALWFAYVLLAGVAGGLVTAITSASTLLYSVLVWLVGDPRFADAGKHFEQAPTQAAAAVVGLLVWWYHQAVLEEAGAGPRTEVRRIYEYLMAGIGLLAAAAGLTTAVVALIEAVTGPERVIVGGGSTVNTLLAAATLLAVGAPVWWLYWRRIQAAAKAAPAAELMSTTRRLYLFVLFGLGGVAAVIALLVGVYLFFEDVVDGDVGAETLRRMRFSIGVLLTTAAIAAYHWAVYRADREHVPAEIKTHGPKFVLLVGPSDPEIAHEVAQRTHGQVRAWSRTDDGSATWSVDEVMAALGGTTSDEVIVLSDAGGVRAIPVHRG